MYDVKEESNASCADGKKGYGKFLIILTILVVLASIFLTLSFFYSKGRPPSGTLRVSLADGEFREFDVGGLEDLPQISARVEIKSTYEPREEKEFQGVLLELLIEEMHRETSYDAYGVRAIAEDGYSVMLTSDDIENGAFIAYKDSGNYIKDRKSGGFGPFRLILPNDEFSLRWVKHLSEIQVEFFDD